MVTDVLSVIDPNREETWKGKLFITLDLDWADDEVLGPAIELLESARVKYTLFVTHRSALVDGLARRGACELGIHPRIDAPGAVASQPTDDPSAFGTLRAAFPSATAVRTHSLVQSSPLHNQFAASGLTHESNTYIPAGCGMDLRPWRIWNGLIRVPFAWADDIHLYAGQADREIAALRDTGLCVIAVHPIHLFLNTDSTQRYASYKDAVRRGTGIDDVINRAHRGIRNIFSEMLEMLL
jgi:hypothetical protein